MLVANVSTEKTLNFILAAPVVIKRLKILRVTAIL